MSAAGIIPPAPYKGLVPYGEEDAALFFGREAERSIIVANLRSSRFTLLYGPSGVGKSSVVGAGVTHFLHQRSKQNLQKRGIPEFAVVLFSQWRDDPIRGLTNKVRESVEALLGKKFDDNAEFSQKSLTEQLKTWAERVGGDLLIILDQFEDYFLYHAGEDGPGTFADEFPRVVTAFEARVHFLVSIREDAVAKLDVFEGRIPTLFDNYIRIDHLDREASRDAIVKPIEQFNKAASDSRLRVEIEPALVDAVLDQVKTGQVSLIKVGAGHLKDAAPKPGTPETARIEAPFLQLVMTRLWDEELRSGSHTLRLETLNKLGGVERIVRAHLDRAMSTLPVSERNAVARVLYYLVTPSGTKIAHTAGDLAAYTGTSERKLTPVLEKLSGAGMCILRPVAPPPDQPHAPSRYEIFHDVLAPAMLDWRRRYLQQQRNRLLAFAGAVAGVAGLLLIGALWFNLQPIERRLAQTTQEAQNLSGAILATPEPTEDVTGQSTLVALRATAAAVGTSTAQASCLGPPSIDFTSTRARIVAGASVSLQWTNALRVTEVTIAPDIGQVPLEGSKTVAPQRTTTYTLTATGCGGTVTREVTIIVEQPTPSRDVSPTRLNTLVPTALPTPTRVLPTPTRPRLTAIAPPPTATILTAPPGVYVTALRVEPPQPRAGQPILFYAKLLNTTGRTQFYNWCVEIFLPENYPDSRKSSGISTCSEREIPEGETELPAPGWEVKSIGGCVQYLARPVLLDPARARIPFVRPDGSEFFMGFTLCP